MSDTDDTDVLLLIPPDFFLVHSDFEESYYEKSHEYYEPHCGVVNNLISQVHQLENRLYRIEVNSEVSHCNSVNSSCNSTIIPLSEMSAGNHYRNTEYKYYPNDGNCISSSTKSTPQKPRHKLAVNSLPSTPSSTDKQSYKHRRAQHYSKFTTQNGPKVPVVQTSHNQSTDADESSFNTTPEKYQDKRILGEIDHFLNNVKTIQNISVQKNLNPAFNAEETNKRTPIRLDEPTITLSDLKVGGDHKRINRLNLKDVDRLLQTMETQQQMMESRDRSVEYLYENEQFAKRKQTWRCGDKEETVPDLGCGMRNIMYNQDNQQHCIEEPIQKIVIPNTQVIPEHSSKSESLNASDSSPPTVLERVSHNPTYLNGKSSSEPTTNTEKINATIKNIIAQTGTDNFSSTQHISSETLTEYNQSGVVNPLYTEVKVPLDSHVSNNQIYFNQPPGNMSSINLFSLADLWNANGANNLLISDKEMKKLLPKLEEEKCRRKHCEKLIQELQMKILEMQQRLAVACQVDSAKDEAILRFHEAWEKVAHRWQSLETERNTLSKKLYTVEEKANVDVINAKQKVTQCEVELSKALDLAHKNQEKSNKLELERSELLSQLSDLRTEVKTTRGNLEEIAKERDQLAERISCLEKESFQGKQLLLETQKEVTHSKTVFQTCQNELTVLRDEHVKLQKRIKEEQSIILQLETQKKNLHHSLDSSKKTESSLQLELKNLQEESERNKIELRNFYQQQVEVLVKDKLKEFQDQLEQAEKSLQDELRNREHFIARSAAKQLQKLTDKHRLEVQLIEEKHKEEVRLYELQFTHMKEQISLLQNKLESYHAKRVNIAQELHTVMETQWREALRIINNGKSPAPGTPQSTELQRTVSDESNRQFCMQDLKRFLSKHEIQASEAIGVSEQGRGDNNDINFRATNSPKDQIPLAMSNELFRNRGTFDTPVSSKSQAQLDQQSESDLKNYIKLLLEKSARQITEKPLENVKMPVSQDSSSSDLPDMSSWQQLLVPKMNDKSSAASSKEYRTEKPPWK